MPANLPAGQFVHEIPPPGAGAYVPALQFVHAAAPAADCAFPGGQGKHAALELRPVAGL